MIDLGIPRAVDPAIGQLDSVYLYNVDDLKTIAEKNLANRETEAKKVKEMVQKAALTFTTEWSRKIEIPEGRADFILVNP